MRVLVYPADLGRCGQRLLWPAEVLRSQGAQIIVGHDYGRDDPVWTEGADVVVMQRPMHRRFVEPFQDDLGRWTSAGAIQLMQADGIRVVVDIDDDFMALNRNNAVWHRTHPSQSPDVNWQHLSAACRIADLVTVTTPALARRYGAHGRVAIIPNHVPESYLSIERPVNDRPVVGWTGAVATHPDDLQVTRGGVCRALQQTGAQFLMVGPLEGVQRALGLSEEPTATGLVYLDEYPYEMARIDVGIVPLELTAFNQAKSTLKGLEFAALGIPYVASPTDPYVELARHGCGLIAERPKAWQRLVHRLLTDDPFRVDAINRGWRYVETQTIEGNAHLWWEAWESARQRSRRKVLT